MIETFHRSLRGARRALVLGRILDAIAFAVAAGVLGGAIVGLASNGILGGEGWSRPSWIGGGLVAIAVLALRGRRASLGLEPAARLLDARVGGGAAIASAAAVLELPSAGLARLCVRDAARRLGGLRRASLLRPSRAALAAIPIAAALAFAVDATGPTARRSPTSPLADLGRVEGWARTAGGARGEALAAEAARLRETLLREDAALTAETAVRIARLGREAASLSAEGVGEPGAGSAAAGAGHEGRAAALRLARIVEEGVRHRFPRAGNGAGEEGVRHRFPEAGNGAGEEGVRHRFPEAGNGARPPETVPLRFEEVVARYFARSR